MGITVKTDFDVNATYIKLSTEPIARTVVISDLVNVDLDQYGVAVGVELLSNDAPLPLDRLLGDYHVHSSVVALLRMLRIPAMSNTNDGLTTRAPRLDFAFVS